ncbi:MAG: energy transducer TonB [Prevotella fusca]
MKRLFLLLLCLGAIVTHSLAQNAKQAQDTTKVYYVAADAMPKYPGGYGALRAYLTLTLRYPDDAQKAGVGGNLLMLYTVTKDGSIKHISVKGCSLVTPDGQRCDKGTGGKLWKQNKKYAKAFIQEAKRVISLMPKWEPAMLNGKAVEVAYSLPLNFKLR